MYKEIQKTDERKDAPYSQPSVSLPKGGGAIKSIDEKFAANPVTGTGSLTIPLPLSPGRSEFAPVLTLSYDSGAGNGPFGFGWSIGCPCITRRTDRGLPQYLDAEESDVFILSNAEDLVPVLNEDGSRFEDSREGYRVTRYRPRIEGLFACIERWTNISDPADTYWRSISSDNITTFYGKTAESRIADPADATRIFSWLICQSYDDTGDAILYEYRSENSDGLDESQFKLNEKNRTPARRTANTYLKRVKYGNRSPNRHPTTWQAFDSSQLPDDTWMFDLVFDYGEGHYSEALPDLQERIFAQAQINAPPEGKWSLRSDPFSNYRAAFEIRTYRLCRRVLMFHHFPTELQTDDYLVRSLDFTYNSTAIASFISQVTESGYVRQVDGTYLKKSLPPLNLGYSAAIIKDELKTLDVESLKNLPVGTDGGHYQWLDLDGEGMQGVLSEQSEGWYYKRNLSPISTVRQNGEEKVVARLDAVEKVETLPSLLDAGRHQFLDLAGDGNLDLVQFAKPVSGFFERTNDDQWTDFIPFASIPNLTWSDPNQRFIDLTGDGHADILLTEDHALVWYPSLAEEGFGRAIRVPITRDDEKGPAVVFADGTQAVFTADLSGDGLTDIVRIRNGEVCYWPNLGYGNFGSKITMDNAPWFDAPDQFDYKRIQLADIDGSGTTDIIYVERNRVAIYRNECGNAWGAAEYVESFPAVDDLSSVTTVDLLGNGTACLVWSSSLPTVAGRQMRYIDLMGGLKPHLLTHITNNLGAETLVEYAPSTKFYLTDKLAGKPWVTRLPFPVHVVERVETRDLISRNRFVTRYNYHHGYFDGIDREFRGFGMVEQQDTEEFAALNQSGVLNENVDPGSHVPPVVTKTWFHTGAYLEGERISRVFEDEYYHEGDDSEGSSGLSHEQLQAMLLPDTHLPTTLKRKDGPPIPWNLTTEEAREACRALKGSVLRQEVYALDDSDEQDRPYTTSERNYTIELLQPAFENRNAVFSVHQREAIEFHYERKLSAVGDRRLADPRVTHAMTLEADWFGNVLKSAAIAYGRRHIDPSLSVQDREKQKRIHATYTEAVFTKPLIDGPDTYRIPLPCEVFTYELIELPQLSPAADLPDVTNLFTFEEILTKTQAAGDGQHDLAYENIEAEGAQFNQPYRRLIEHVRTLYRKDDLTGLIRLGQLEPLALPGESYKLALTPGLLRSVYKRGTEELLANASTILGSKEGDGGGYARSNDLKAANLFPATDPDDHWWIPSGRVFFSANANVAEPAVSALQELAEARGHFFLPRKFADAFDRVATIDYDDHSLLLTRTTDALENLVQASNEYRVLQPRLITDPNGNRSEVAFDALGMVAGTAVMGRSNEEGDLLDDSFKPDPLQVDLNSFFAEPCEPSANVNETVATETTRKLLANATTRILYDLNRFQRIGEAPVAATLARETHFRAPGGVQSKIQISFSYSDGFGREIQKKIQAEPGPVDEGGPDVNPRWVGSGWTIFNNKGKPVRQYEPFFSRTHNFEFARTAGVSPVLFYDPVERVVATLHPNHTWEKVVFDPWQSSAHDVNDTVTLDPRTDNDVKDFFNRLPGADYLPTWFSLRTDTAHAQQFAQQYPEAKARANETRAAIKSQVHAATPTVTYFDSLDRAFLTVSHNKLKYSNTSPGDPPIEEFYRTRIMFDIEGNQREVIDARDRIVMRYDYDMLGDQIHQSSMEAGERWVLNDVTGNPILAWDSRGHSLRTEYDALRRPKRSFVTGADSEDPDAEIQVVEIVYGEEVTNAPASLNLRGQVLFNCDTAGLIVNVGVDPQTEREEAFDFKGNPLRITRHVAREYKKQVNWNDVNWNAVNAALSADQFELAEVLQPFSGLLETESFTSNSTYDALNRIIITTAPDNSVYRPTFNEANLLEKVEVNLRGENVVTTFVTDIDYDAKGQRTLIHYGNDAETTYEYDPLTFRLANLKTTRTITQNGLSSVILESASVVQDLRYTYDPAGNITRIEDPALKTINQGGPIEPVSQYTYDATYRLIEAEGREHIGQTTRDFNPENRRDYDFVGHAHPNDLTAMRNYTERYEYDAVGNFRFMHHVADGGSWTRSYIYDQNSLLNSLQKSNRLTRTELGNSDRETYTYSDAPGNDVHGCMTSINNMKMSWDFRDQLHEVDLGGGGTAYYVYDANGQRVRKVIESQNGSRVKERIYLSGFEVYREFNSNGTATLERETLQVMDDEQRIALIETKTVDNAQPVNFPEPVSRYQLSDHLGSASTELDHQAQLVSYEEYHPHGTTSFQAGRSAAEVSLKRYRYTGMERDEETGLAYHGARHFAPWLGRWTSCDPSPLIDGPNLYRYVVNNPIAMIDLSGHGPEHQGLGARGEKSSKKQQDTANARRKQKGLKPIDVERQKGVGGKRETIPDEVKTQPIKDPIKEPEKVPRKTVVELKSRNIHNWPDSAARRADIKESLEQNKKQLVELEKAGEIGPKDKGKVVRVIFDNDKGKSATKARAELKNEGVQAHKEWLQEAADDPVELAKRQRVNIVTTTQERVSKATKTTRTRLMKQRLTDIASSSARRGKSLAKTAVKGTLQSIPILGSGIDAYFVGVNCLGPNRSVAGCADAVVSAVPVIGDVYTGVKMVGEFASALWDTFESSPGSAIPAGFITPFVMKPLRYSICYSGQPCSYRK